MLDKTSPLHAHVKPLQACIAAYTAPLAEDEKAQIASTKLETQLSVARTHWMLAYDVLCGEMRSLFAGPSSHRECGGGLVVFAGCEGKCADGREVRVADAFECNARSCGGLGGSINRLARFAPWFH